MATVAAPRGEGAAVAGALGCRMRMGGAGNGKRRGRSGGEEDADMGRRWRAWRRPVEQERRGRGPGGSWRRLRERDRRE